MYRLEYTPRALNDLERIKEYVISRHGGDVAEKSLKRLTSSARRLENFPKEGPKLESLILVSTDYRYLFIKPYYLFYRIEGNSVRIIRTLNEQQDFLQILFGIATVSDENTEE